MTVVVISERTPVARRPHVCNECGRSIPVGERYRSQFNTYEGDSYTWRFCEHCSAVHHAAGNARIIEDDCGITLYEALVDSGSIVFARMAVGMRRHWRYLSGRPMPVPAVPPRLCVDCPQPVDAPRSYTWCAACDATRIARLTGQFRSIRDAFAVATHQTPGSSATPTGGPGTPRLHTPETP